MRHRRALLFLDNERNQQGRHQPRNQRQREHRPVVLMRQRQQRQRGRRTRDGSERVHHPLKAERAPVGFGGDGPGQNRFPHWRAHASSQPGAGAGNEDMPCAGRQAEAGCAQRRHQVSQHRNRFAARQPVGGEAGSHFGHARQTVRHPFDESQPSRRHVERGQERGQQRVAVSCAQSLNSEARPMPSTVRFSQCARRPCCSSRMMAICAFHSALQAFTLMFTHKPAATMKNSNISSRAGILAAGDWMVEQASLIAAYPRAAAGRTSSAKPRLRPGPASTCSPILPLESPLSAGRRGHGRP